MCDECETEGVQGLESNKRSTIEDALQDRAAEAVDLLLQFTQLDPGSPSYASAVHQAQFLRGVVAGLKYAIRRVREDEAASA